MSSEDILKKYWGYDGFRGIQRDIIDSVLAGHDTLGLMPTGGGKSITFQVPALMLDGVTIVITPLIALMKDQVDNLRRRGIKAAAIYTGMKRADIVATLENAIFGAVKLLYVSPERLESDIFRRKLSHMTTAFICVDEAHCISQWGYDFRPSYLTIADIRQVAHRADGSPVPVLALTATATPRVVVDIEDKLCRERDAEGRPLFQLFRMSFERKNLAYSVRLAADKEQQLLQVLAVSEGSVIIYARSRRRTEETARMLVGMGHSATFYHAGLDNVERDLRQKKWLRGDYRIIVATNAFGMGIDKPDVRLVVHIDCPDSIEAYFQEAGRAGRDGLPADAVMLYNGADARKLHKRIEDMFPSLDYTRRVYDCLCYFYQIAVGDGYLLMYEFPIDRFCQTYHFFPVQVESALHTLQRAGYVEYVEEKESQARVFFLVDRDDLYRLRGASSVEDCVIVCLLRTYTGLFVDYQYIDMGLLALEAGVGRHELYVALKNLNDRHIISFIPEKKTPYVRFLQRREDSADLVFPPLAYTMLRQQMTDSIEAILDYCSSADRCRSTIMLKYFGESSAHECGQCDVCLDRNPSADTAGKVKAVKTDILALLADGKPHPVGDLLELKAPMQLIDRAITELADSGQLHHTDGIICAG